MSLYVMSDAPIKDVVNLLLQEPYTENTIARNQDPEAYDIRTLVVFLFHLITELIVMGIWIHCFLFLRSKKTCSGRFSSR